MPNSKKNLLNESQIRQFMKLAKLEPLTPGFVMGLTENSNDDIGESHGRGKGENPPHARLEEADEEAELDATEDELGDMDAEDDRERDEIDDLEDDLGAEEASDARMVSVDDFLSALERALEDAMGEEVEVDASEMDMDDDPVEDDVEVDADVDMDVDGDDMEVDMEADEEMLQEEEGSKSHEYRRKDKDGKVGHRAGEGKDGHYKDYEGPEGGNKGDKSKTDPGHKDYMKESAATDELVEQITKRVAARILKSALAKK